MSEFSQTLCGSAELNGKLYYWAARKGTKGWWVHAVFQPGGKPAVPDASLLLFLQLHLKRKIEHQESLMLEAWRKDILGDHVLD